jgi:hypothetical protein
VAHVSWQLAEKPPIDHSLEERQMRHESFTQSREPNCPKAPIQSANGFSYKTFLHQPADQF